MTPNLSLFLPSKGETEDLWRTVEGIHAALTGEGISHEFVVVNDVVRADQGGTASKMAEFAVVECEFNISRGSRRPADLAAR